MNKYFASFLLVVTFLFVTPCSVNANSIIGRVIDSEGNNINALKKELIEEAQKESVKKELAEKYISSANINKKVLELSNHQPELTKTYAQYMNMMLTKDRINKARDLYHKHYKLLKKLQKEYEVQPQYIIAFWGMETNFGSYQGNFDVVDALFSLIYANKRPEFFKRELFSLLKAIEKSGVEEKNMKSSWAGAMGNFQFMPSTYLRYAVDYDKDGKKDIWNSFPDAAASAANYLSSIGWDKEEIWGRQITVPWDFDFSEADISVKKPLSYWRKKGVMDSKGKLLPNLEMKGAIILPEGHRGDKYIVYSNYKVIMSWNYSILYSLAVGNLADLIVSRTSVKAKKTQEKGFSKEIVKDIQSKLNQVGLGTMEVDGVYGGSTRDAVRKIQKELLLPQDGYPSAKFVERLDKYTAEKGYYPPLPRKKPKK